MKKLLFGILPLFLLLFYTCKKAEERVFNEHPAETITVHVDHDTSICMYSNQKYILDVGTGNPNSIYYWLPFSWNSSVIEADYPMYYIVDIYTDTIHQQFHVSLNNCELYMFYPNSFTPNNDGMNDCWRPVGVNILAGSGSLKIFNSLDHLLFESTPDNFTSSVWNGAVEKDLCPAGYYYYDCKYKSLDGQQFHDAGMLQLIR